VKERLKIRKITGTILFLETYSKTLVYRTTLVLRLEEARQENQTARDKLQNIREIDNIVVPDYW